MMNYNDQEESQEDRYGISVGCRLPGAMAKEIADEAERRGITRAKHLASIIAAARQESDNEKEQHERLLRENNLLKTDLAQRESQFEQATQKALQANARLNVLEERNNTYKHVWDAQLQNEAILKKLYIAYKNIPIDMHLLLKEGFDFHLIIKKVLIEKNEFNGFFHYAYRVVEKGKVIIEVLDQVVIKNKDK